MSAKAQPEIFLHFLLYSMLITGAAVFISSVLIGFRVSYVRNSILALEKTLKDDTGAALYIPYARMIARQGKFGWAHLYIVPLLVSGYIILIAINLGLKIYSG